MDRSARLRQYEQRADLNARMPGFKIHMGFGLHVGWAIEGAIGACGGGGGASESGEVKGGILKGHVSHVHQHLAGIGTCLPAYVNATTV